MWIRVPVPCFVACPPFNAVISMTELPSYYWRNSRHTIEGTSVILLTELPSNYCDGHGFVIY